MDQSRSSSTVVDFATAEQGLSALLEDEVFLLKVLKHLIDDGLHECRRVCRFWCNVCNKLPVRLRILSEDKILPAIKKFPNCVSFSAEQWWSDDERIAQAKREESDQDASIFDHFAKLSQLKTLKLTLEWFGEQHAQNLFGQLFGSLPRDWHPALRQLCSFELQLCVSSEDEGQYLCSQLRFLTNLTALKFFLGVADFVVEPFTELQKIEHLETRNLLLNIDGQLMFPNLTSLTHLYFAEDIYHLPRLDGGVLEAILPYASSLELITIDVFASNLRLADNMSVVKEFSRLKSVKITDEEYGFDVRNFWHGLKHLSAMTSFHVDFAYDMPVVMAEDASSLTKLRSLTLKNDCDVAAVSVILSNTMQLTQLTLSLLGNEEPLSYLTGLKDLCIYSIERPGMDLSRVLTCMPLLESLQIRCAVRISNLCLSQLRKLTSLELREVLLDANPFTGLALLPELTKLHLDSCEGIDNEYLSEVNRLTNLKDLALLQSRSIDPCSHIGELIRLRVLRLPTGTLTASSEKELYRRLPSIRRIYSIEQWSFYD